MKCTITFFVTFTVCFKTYNKQLAENRMDYFLNHVYETQIMSVIATFRRIFRLPAYYIFSNILRQSLFGSSKFKRHKNSSHSTVQAFLCLTWQKIRLHSGLLSYIQNSKQNQRLPQGDQNILTFIIGIIPLKLGHSSGVVPILSYIPLTSLVGCPVDPVSFGKIISPG